MTDRVAGRHVSLTARPPLSFGQRVSGQHVWRRVLFYGLGRIDGTVFVKDTPSRRKVRLMERKTGVPRMTTYSAADGAYRFDYLPMDRKYVLLGLDYTGEYNAVVEDNVTPEIPERRG